jgi:hypothetical protein
LCGRDRKLDEVPAGGTATYFQTNIIGNFMGNCFFWGAEKC